MSDDIKTGDVVMLKSGGPRMTVGEIGPMNDSGDGDDMQEGECVCAWFNQHPRPAPATYCGVERGTFHVSMLKKVDTDDGEG